jgi:hypothetical protein
VSELERNLELERPRESVDLRNTLRAPDASRKVVAYEVSELRAIEVIDGLCGGMDQFGITREEDGFISFQRYNANGAGTVRIEGQMVIGNDEFMSQRKMLENYCDAILEEYEDDFTEAIRSAGLAKLARKQEELKVAKARREGRDISQDPEIDELTRSYAVLDLDPIASPSEVRKAYRALSKKLHPDKLDLDKDPKEANEKLAEFHRVAKAYETITGEQLAPYGDLYRQVCIEILDVCDNEEDIEKVRGYFPKVKGSKVKGMIEDDEDVQGRLGFQKGKKTKLKKKKKKSNDADVGSRMSGSSEDL